MKLPVFPNWYPYNDMLLDGRLQLGEYGVKTRSYDWDYRGDVLLYNSGRTAWHCVNNYEYESGRQNHGIIIGVGRLVSVRELKQREEYQMYLNFNNLTRSQARRLVEREGYRAGVYPLPFGYFFTDLKRFEKPIQFNWPSGPIRPIFTTVREGSLLKTQLVDARA